MPKYRVTEVLFKEAHPHLGGSAWMDTIKQGGYESVEYDSTECMLTLIPGTKTSGLKKRRIHVSNTKDLVYGVMLAGPKSGTGGATD